MTQYMGAVLLVDRVPFGTQLIRDLIKKHTGVKPPELPKPPAIAKYGKVVLNESAALLEQLNTLFPGDGIASDYPDIMEEFGQS
jgi:hypothetical protein